MKYNDEVRYWMNEIDDAKKREKDYRKNGETIIDLYNGDKPDEHPFNILYSNTETLQPALYSQVPRPAVKERFPEKDNKGFTKVNPLNKAVCEASNHMLSYLIDTNIGDYDSFHDSIKAVVLDSLLPGRGVTTIKFDAILKKDEKGEDKEVEWASIIADTKKYSRIYMGFATKWEKTPWVAYEEYVDETEAEKLFGAEKSKELQYTVSEEDEKNATETEERRQTACVYQIWDKDSKTLKWCSPAYTGYLREDDDPLEITGFFNTPRPLMLHRKSNDLMPTPLYTLYENQAKELDRITRSINKVVQAIKVRGVYDGNFGDELERLMDEEDNVLIPTDKVSSFVDGGFDKHIWMLPLGELAGVLQQLYVAREQCKQVIYEITGISDILRGQSKASETLGAQKVKEAWGTMRLKNMQSDVQEYVRDVLRMMLDVAVKKMPQAMWIKVTGLPYPTREIKEQGVELMNKLQTMIQESVQSNNEKQLKKLQKEAAELAEVLTMPSWEDILEVLDDDYIRSFKVDIETNSTLDVEATEDKKNIAEAMNAMAQFMNGLMPMVKEGILPFGAAKSMLLDICKRFRFGVEVEDEINAMTEPKGGEEQAEAQKKKLEEAGKKLQQEKQKLGQEQEKFEQEQKRVGDQLDDQFKKLEMDNMKFEFKKKLFQEQQKMERDLATEKLKNMDEVMSAKQEIKTAKAEAGIQKQLDKAERTIQGLMDKQMANIEKTADRIGEDIKQIEMPEERKVSFIYDGEDIKGLKMENGQTITIEEAV